MTAFLFKPNRNIILITILAFTDLFRRTFMLHTVPLSVKNKIANGLLADFVLTFPALYYFLIVRPLKVSISGCCLL